MLPDRGTRRDVDELGRGAGPRADGRGADRGRALRAAPRAVRALRRPARRCRRRLVRRHAVELAERGRLQRRPDRRLARGGRDRLRWSWPSRPGGSPSGWTACSPPSPAALVFLLYLPTALLVDAYPVPTLFMSCSEDCPANAFDVVSPEPGVRQRLHVSAAGADPGRDHDRGRAAARRPAARGDPGDAPYARAGAPRRDLPRRRARRAILLRRLDLDERVVHAACGSSRWRCRSSRSRSSSASCAGGCSWRARCSASPPSCPGTPSRSSCAPPSPTRSTTRRSRSSTGSTTAGSTRRAARSCRRPSRRAAG